MGTKPIKNMRLNSNRKEILFIISLMICGIMYSSGVTVGQEKEDTKDGIQNVGEEPAAEYRPYMIWSWNVDPDKRGIEDRVRAMKEDGYGGFMIMPTRGCPYEYTSGP